MLRRRIVLAAVALAAMVAPQPAHAAAPPPLPLTCATYGDQRICSGQVASFDGAPLDVDLTLPLTTGGGRHPLMIMLHGFGNNKHEWESVNDTADTADKWHWNSHWFAEHGYFVLTYTARGFQDGGPSQSWQPPTPSPRQGSESLPNGTIHLKSREFEGRDTQWLAGLVAANYRTVDPNKVAVTGGSYGGGESWLQAAQPVWQPGPGLPTLQLQVAVAKYPWSDLGYSLAPNGHPGGPSSGDLYMSSSGRPNDPAGRGYPVGVPKASYVTGFYALGTQDGQFERGTTTPTYEEGPINLDTWNARVMGTGDPYDAAGVEDPIVAQVRRGLTVFRSAYYQSGWAAQASSREVAVFSVSGWTDDLFPPVESFRMFKYLKSIDPMWPVEVDVADVGHPRAQNKPAQWQRINDRANQFLAGNIDGGRPASTQVVSQPTICGSSQAGDEIMAPTPEGLAAGRLTVAYSKPGALTAHAGLADPNGPATDPVLSSQAPGVVNVIAPSTGQCRRSPGPAVGGATMVSKPLPQAETLAGIADVKVSIHLTGATSASLDARLWDVAPTGEALLVSRGAYRVDVPAYDNADETIRLPFFGNQWTFAAGHSLRLDLTQADTPTFRSSTPESAIAFEPPLLEVPTREAGSIALTGA